MACVKSPSFSICVNGDIHGFFKGKRGLRQDDPLSPYLFTLVMEVLTLILQRRVRLSDSFRYHKQCEELRIINVCFADDLFLFSRGDVASATVIMDSLNEFKQVSGLVPSIPKSTASVLAIPFGIIDDIQQLIRGFLWCNGEYKRGKAKVSWEDICLPKRKGGLGIRCLKVFNIALMTTHIWNIVSNKESLWVRWIHMYKLKGRTLWDIRPKASMSWGWRKLLQLRDVVKPFLWKQVGNGHRTSLWYDTWCDQSPLANFLTPKDNTRNGFHFCMCVADIITNRAWDWPQAWLLKAPNLGLILVPVLNDTEDCIRWHDGNGNVTSFSVKCAWEALRPQGVEAPWYSIVWFSHCIPRHAFHMWLIMRRSLKTQDKLRSWDIGPDIDITQLRCSLCGLQMDSHEHTFFECSFSSKVWSLLRHLAGMERVAPVLEDIIA
ncbi:hypothetical protein Tco_0296479 [Tanacetum coccineum]